MYDKHLDYFIMVADLGSFSKAAEKAFISPNAIIKQVNLLEADLGVQLFERTNMVYYLQQLEKASIRMQNTSSASPDRLKKKQEI